ncbi:MAG: hypothetical protein RSD95_13205, partial [Clostridia bacterium]
MDKADFSIVDTLDEMRYELDATPNARYGGYYYTENMKRMKVCIPHGQPPLPIRASASSYVGTVWVDNSLDMLDDAYEAATSILNQHGLNAVTIDVLTNCVALGVDEDTPQVRDELLRKLAKLGTQGYRLRTRATQGRLNIIFTLPKGLFRLISNIENEVRQMNKTETKLYL